jgi:fructosamine-3-kinase
MSFALDAVQRLIELEVSSRLGRPWRVAATRDMVDYASHPSAVLSDGVFAVFAKLSTAVDAFEQFSAETAGLQLLSERAGVLTPAPLGVVAAPGGWVLLLEAVDEVPRGPLQWREIGQTLARIHRVQGETCGLATNGFFGPLPQDNTPARDWPTFYAERRLLPGLKLARDAGCLGQEAVRHIERVVTRLPQLCGPPVTPCLLHGDAQQNNFISSLNGAVVIDPAVYYGHPEMDLAAVDFFEPVPDVLFDGYRDEHPIDAGFAERRELWRLWSHLACATVAGGPYLERLMAAVRRYV